MPRDNTIRHFVFAQLDGGADLYTTWVRTQREFRFYCCGWNYMLALKREWTARQPRRVRRKIKPAVTIASESNGQPAALGYGTHHRNTEADMPDSITQTCNSLMRAVARSGCIRTGNEADYTLGSQVMREELKSFLSTDDAKYADERQLTLTGQSGLAMASLVAECIRRILAERAA